MDSVAQASDSGTEMGRMWKLNQQIDRPLDVEAAQVRESVSMIKALPALVVLRLAFQSLGIVYGDLGTSPLYVFHSTFPKGISGNESLMGVLSCIIYSLTLLPLIKYTFIVMRANDNGEGGTFALYSSICRHARVNTIANQHPTDRKLTTYSQQISNEDSLAGKAKKWLEAKDYWQNLLVILVLFGTSMVIGDGILTPAISECLLYTNVSSHGVFEYIVYPWARRFQKASNHKNRRIVRGKLLCGL